MSGLLQAIAERNDRIRRDLDAAILDAEALWDQTPEFERRSTALIVLARLRCMRADVDSVSRLLEAMKP